MSQPDQPATESDAHGHYILRDVVKYIPDPRCPCGYYAQVCLQNRLGLSASEPCRAEWQRALEVSRAVLKLEVLCPWNRDLLLATKVAESVLGEQLFSNLEELELDYHYADPGETNLYPELVRDTLRRCKLHLPRKADLPVEAGFIIRLAAATPDLQELDIEGAIEATNEGRGESFRNLENSWNCLPDQRVWPNLQILRATRTLLPMNMICALATYSNLRELHFLINDEDPFKSHDPAQKFLPSLRVLSVTHMADESGERTAKDLRYLLNHIKSPDLTELILKMAHTTLHTFRRILTAIRRHKNLRAIEIMAFCGPHGRERRPVVNFADFSPLYSLTALESLKVVGLAVLNIRAEDIPKIGRTWVHLHTLEFCALGYGTLAAHYQECLPIQDLRLFGVHCPSLRRLMVPFDGHSSYPDVLENNMVFPDIEVSGFDGVVFDSWTEERVVAFLLAMFPSSVGVRPWRPVRDKTHSAERETNIEIENNPPYGAATPLGKPSAFDTLWPTSAMVLSVGITVTGLLMLARVTAR